MTGPATTRRHSRDDVATTALSILDRFGLPDLTMRRLAAALDVQPSALYWHFPNKQTLIAELADRIVARTTLIPADPVPAPVSSTTIRAGSSSATDWADVTRRQAHALRDSLLAYRDGAEVVTSTMALGLGSHQARSLFLEAIALGGFDERTVSRASTAILHFVLGHVHQEQQSLQFDSLGVRASHAPIDDPAADFAFGVEIFLRGIDAHVDRDAPADRGRTDE